MVPDPVDVGAEPADMPPGAPEEPPAQAFLVMELLPPAQSRDDGTGLLRGHPLGSDLGIAQKLQTSVRENAHHPVEHIGGPEPDK